MSYRGVLPGAALQGALVQFDLRIADAAVTEAPVPSIWLSSIRLPAAESGRGSTRRAGE